MLLSDFDAAIKFARELRSLEAVHARTLGKMKKATFADRIYIMKECFAIYLQDLLCARYSPAAVPMVDVAHVNELLAKLSPSATKSDYLKELTSLLKLEGEAP